ncbi:LysE family translocator [Natronomonas marina]|jgi:threonine/homoserine/homoserine lactone efflux protein|uniref:LysE family translocator n=1 Tax=Natronomonas marina TaxID=2961939 RepID=UPI0020C9CDA3|nr:LysE family translocator [Natronomonas marina]
MALVTTLLAGVVFGLALAAPPGPMNAVIAEESVLRGWRSGFKAGLGAMTADFVFFVLALFGAVAVVERVPTLRNAMVAVGGLLMLYFAYGAARGARESFRASATPNSRGFSKAFVLALTNPYQILFWLTVGVGLLAPGRIDVLSYATEALAGLVVVETGHPALLVGLFGGILVWIVGFPWALSAAESRTERAAPVVAVLSAAVLVAFGLYFLYDAATGFALFERLSGLL